MDPIVFPSDCTEIYFQLYWFVQTGSEISDLLLWTCFTFLFTKLSQSVKQSVSQWIVKHATLGFWPCFSPQVKYRLIDLMHTGLSNFKCFFYGVNYKNWCYRAMNTTILRCYDCTVRWNCMQSTCLFYRQKPLSHELWSEWVSEQMSAVERASAANEWVVRANERADEQMTQYCTRRFHIISTHSGLVL